MVLLDKQKYPIVSKSILSYMTQYKCNQMEFDMFSSLNISNQSCYWYQPLLPKLYYGME